MEHFISKRNKVYPLNDAAVCKEYRSMDVLAVERQNLLLLKRSGLCAIPEVLAEEGNTLTLSRLPGENYADLLPKLEGDSALGKAAMEALCHWLFCYYDASGGQLRGDVNLRNFLFDGSVCYSVDFEEPLKKGPIERDLGGILAYLGTYDPVFTEERILLGAMFLKKALQLGADADGIHKGFCEELYGMVPYRGERFGPILQKGLNSFPIMLAKANHHDIGEQA
ncbi:MAG: hypothetical protein E7328_04710 [Clostridiales bacterium]|nr:hypothetical protein [Clostridiales bacterium]